MKRKFLCLLLIGSFLLLSSCANRNSNVTSENQDAEILYSTTEFEANIIESDVVGSENPNAESESENPNVELENENSNAESENENSNAESENDDLENMAYIIDFDGNSIELDVVEWVMIPSSRAEELGLGEDDGPSGFFVYNPDTSTERFALAKDCKITVLDTPYQLLTVATEDFISILQERGEKNEFTPYSFEITNGEITQIREKYVP